MQLVPVLEIRHGKCVHAEPKNQFVDEVVKEDVLEVVAGWVEQGVERIHLVDVDAVESGEPSNVVSARKIKQNYPQLIVQVLGGISCIESAYIWMDADVDYMVLNGKAIRQRNLLDDICVEFPEKVLVELDSREGNVGMGSGEPTFKLASLASQLEEDGVVGLIITEVPENGHVNQNNLLSIGNISQGISIPVFANGGVEKLDDLKCLLDNYGDKLSGVLVGKVMFNDFPLEQANRLLKNYPLK